MSPELEPIVLKLEGSIADTHKIDAFQLAETITGFGQVIGHSLYLLQRLEVAGKRQRVKDLQILAKPPEAGSVELMYVVEAVRDLSPIFIEPFLRHRTELLWRMVGSAFLLNSGRKSEAMQIAEILIEYLESRDEKEAAQRSEERAKDERVIHNLIEGNAQRCQGGCKNAVASIGKTSRQLNIPFKSHNIEINEGDASKIRASAEESIGPEGSFRCLMDGIIEHNRTIKIQIENSPEEGNYITANVEDSSFGQTDNPYITALNTKRPIIVNAKPVLKEGEIVRLIISEAEVD